MAASIMNKTSKELTNEEYIVKYAITYLAMKKCKDDSVAKILENDDNKAAFKIFEGRQPFLFVKQLSPENMSISVDPPNLDKETKGKKSLLVVKTVTNADPKENPFPNGIAKDIVFMELNKPILENLLSVCQGVFMPVLGNPLNQIGWSDLVSKDLMDKFHSFLAYTVVTIGLVKGRTVLPLPPSDVTSSEKTSSKDKSVILENAIIQWSRQIKHVLKQDPENALKKGMNPDPTEELNFWKNKSDNLNSICTQLSSERIKKVLKFLEQNKSTYTSTFSKLQKEVHVARKEANENCKYLQTLEVLFKTLVDPTKDLNEVAELFVPIMHTILMIWTYSEFYNTPARLVVLIREICNAIITACHGYINGEGIKEYISADSPQDAHVKLEKCIDVCAKFKEAYFDYKSKSKNQWKITTNALFVRLDAFSERCQDIMHLTGTIQQFNKLAKIEIGNTKGKTMTSSVMNILEKFNESKDTFMMVNYDIVDIEIREFDDDFYIFRQKIKELERRLASVLTGSFDDCDTIIGKFKLLESFDGLLNRQIIQDELEKKHVTLLELYKQDLKVVSNIFHEGRLLVEQVDERAPIANNMPPIAGALYWTSGLLERVEEPHSRLDTLSTTIKEREEYKDVQKLYQSLVRNLKEFQDLKIAQWVEGVEQNTAGELNKFLLVREDTDLFEEGFVRVNFDPILKALLREVKYLLLLDLEVPETAAMLYAKVDVYRNQTGNLELIVEMYNNMLSTLLPVEKPLLADRIEKMGNALQAGIDTLRWNSENINPFINNAMKIVTDVDILVKKMKDNIHKIHSLMEQWQKPLYERKKTYEPDVVQQFHSATVGPRHDDIRSQGKEIHKLLRDTQDNIKPDKKGYVWLQYVDYVNGLLIEGITLAINSSMAFLADQINLHSNRVHMWTPIFEIKVDLIDSELDFLPSIDCNERNNGIRDILNEISNDFISIAIQIPRLDNKDATGGDYLVEIRDQFELFDTMEDISSNFEEVKDAGSKFLDQYRQWEFLWKEEISDSFNKFLDTGTDLYDQYREQQDKLFDNEEPEEKEQKVAFAMMKFEYLKRKIFTGVTTQQPDLAQFDKKIEFLHTVKNNIDGQKLIHDIGWLKVSSQSLINTLHSTVQEWIEKYTQYLLQNTTSEINNIRNFVQNVSQGIENLPEASETKEEKLHLMQVMEHLRDVKMITDNTLARIEPMKQTIVLLKKHGVAMKPEEDFLVILENIKTDLSDTAEKALGPVKGKILPIQKKESENIKEEVRNFRKQVEQYRNEFKSALPYHIEESSDEIIQDAYNKIDEYHSSTDALIKESERLRNLETLFDLTESKFKQLDECKHDLINLKRNWDLISLVDGQFDSWKKTLWDQIDTDSLIAQARKMASDQTKPELNKEIKGYKSFQMLNERLKNMMRTLPLIAQLHSKYMQERHWKKLMQFTCKSVPFTAPTFCLNDLVVMELQKYEADVEELVEGAQKEDKIENKLKDIIKSWDKMKFEFEMHKEVPILTETTDIVELVEQHGMDIQGMLASKDVAEFKETVEKWRNNMKTLDIVIDKWKKVQADWKILRPIFIESEDIRAQLPESTVVFQKVNEEWKELMLEAQDEPGVINAATAEGRLDKLKMFEAEIGQCNKALNEQLESKRKLFPRFYFVSVDILLTILSNGQNPELVNAYMGDCFDGMEFVMFDESGERPWKVVQGMKAKDGEVVDWNSKLILEPPVEAYMNDIERGMQKTLVQILEVAKANTEQWRLEQPREIWLEDYNAQISLLSTQIVWTEETLNAFEELESGAESAMKENLDLIRKRIDKLIDRVRDLTLSVELRVKIITIITVDVHGRDIVDECVTKKIMDSSNFLWARQLKFGMEKRPGYKEDVKMEHQYCQVTICDWLTWYSYEYVGNCGRLVITPLTDRCYITLTQALNLLMGAAPAGPAGTGKTETTKDLGRALGLRVVVYNCSDQMNYRVLANIFMGLAQSGFWGCFDEFNRIAIEVLSVVSSQVKNVLDALIVYKQTGGAKSNFIFMNGETAEDITIKTTVGFFITMNPGYAGRTELPENLKAQFRYCAMVVPDMVLICENMLMSEGFNTAKELAKQFMTLYDLCKSLLSGQVHYDWGLRAVKSLLRSAGGLKRADLQAPENLILMKALRDFNIAKIVEADQAIFMGLIATLFPGMEADVILKHDLRSACCETAVKAGLQTDTGYIDKCQQLFEILEVRHSVFLIGASGLGKSAVWKNLAEALSTPIMDTLTVWQQVDPKAVSSDELCGWENLKTKEWRDGVLSSMFRNMNKCWGKFTDKQKMKWCVFDGDVDPEWIESLNTVMDDNKVLTLVSNERIPLTASMKLIIEVANLRNATPATVSRGGVLFINNGDIGWQPYYNSWLAKFKVGKQKDDIALNSFVLAQNKYISESFQDMMHTSFDSCQPMVDIACIESLVCIVDYQMNQLTSNKTNKAFFDGLRAEAEKNADSMTRIKDMYDCFYAFAMIWAFGGCLDESKREFNGYLRGACNQLKFPEGGSVYDYYYDPIQHQWYHWLEKVKPFDTGYTGVFSSLVVGTAETARQTKLLDMHLQAQKGIIYVGTAGTGKTTIVKNYFKDADPELVLNTQIGFNSYTDSMSLQMVVESKVDKRTGTLYGPPTGKTLIYFVDDLNMPKVDKYFTQQPIALVRQLIDYGTYYDRSDLSVQKRMKDIMFVCCMNPKSGSFFVDIRLTRHLTTICLSVPEKEILSTIYSQLLANHFSEFEENIQKLTPRIINATQKVFSDMCKNPKFAPTAKKFHYQFNMRDFAKIVQNIMMAEPKQFKGKPLEIARLWAHEANRVWKDRLIMPEDDEQYSKTLVSAMKENFPDFQEAQVFTEPLIFTSFVDQINGHDPTYRAINDNEELKKALEKKLHQYNEEVATMELVLFQQAMEHITRIARIIDQPSGHSLLVGVGGSGKQSLSKLSAFILELDVFRIQVSTNYTMSDLKTDIQTVFTKAGAQGNPQLFILTDGQIIDDRFLMYINDILSTGYIPELFASDELEAITGKVRAEAKSNGFLDTPDELFKYFLEKCKKNLHLDLCFSPVGDAFRIRSRMFPGLINSTSIDYFHPWPQDALIGVAERFLGDIELPTEELCLTLSTHMAYVHLSIDEANNKYRAQERRNNYTTPTSFLELIKLYKKLLGDKRGKIIDQIDRLKIGLQTMEDTNKVVAELEVELIDTMKVVEEEKEATGKLIAIVDAEAEAAAGEQAIAEKQEEQVNEATAEAQAKMATAEKELSVAIPLIKEAEAAVDCLSLAMINEFKSFATLPGGVDLVVKAVLILKNKEKRNHSWETGKKMMKDPNKFITELKNFNKEDIEDWILVEMDKIIADPIYKFEIMDKKSKAGGTLCKWSLAIVSYNKVYKYVKPLDDSAKEAKALSEQKLLELQGVQAKVAEIMAQVQELKDKLAEAEDKKRQVEARAEALNAKLDLANRLVGGLADENKRWKENVIILTDQSLTMIGNALLSAAFVSYIGPFNYDFRRDLWENQWIVDIAQNKIPFTEGVDPLEVLSTPADQAGWKGEGLPADRVSLENAAIINNCSRYPLIIDPQLQGQSWIKGKEGSEMQIIQLSQKGWPKKVELAVTSGKILMIEAIGAEIDATLDPLLSRSYTKKGKQLYVKLGADDIEVDPKFKLYLQSKMQNPHYKPEVAAMCTIINFIVTESGLEDQLLADVVRMEKPDLEQTKDELVKQQNEFLITLTRLEAELLTNLSDADTSTILENFTLIEGLEITKKTSNTIKEQQAIAKVTEANINESREIYRRVAAEGAMLYFLIIKLCVVDHMYQYSLESFSGFFFKAIDKCEAYEDDNERVLALVQVIRMTIFTWVARGLFERHKQIFMSLLTFRLMQKGLLDCEYDQAQMNFLVHCPLNTETPRPSSLKDWLPEPAWFAMQSLIKLEGFEQFSHHLEKEAPRRFNDWYNSLTPESDKLPLDWKRLEALPFQKMLVVRVLRPDRVTTALDNFINRTLPNGRAFVECDNSSSADQVLASSYADSTPMTPIFFILSPGANPIKNVQTLARTMGYDPAKQLHQVALGQGQDIIAMNLLEMGHKEGQWIMLQNVHLMPRFLYDVTKKLDAFAVEGSHATFRLFLSSDPSTGIPIELLERSIKLTNEPPAGFKANMKRAIAMYKKEDFDERESKIRTILFGLCYFHSVMCERRKFGPKGFNMKYPFSEGDLRDSSIVLQNYMEGAGGSGKVPWDDLRYLIGEIMYGGHIVNDWDRLLCQSYLDHLLNEQLLDEAELFPYAEGKASFKCPVAASYDKYIEHIDTELPPETPLAFGMHPNTEIDFRTTQCNDLFAILVELQPKSGGSGDGAPTIVDISRDFSERVFNEVQVETQRLPVDEINSKLADDTRGPYQNVYLQECELINTLINMIITDLKDLELAFKGELTMTAAMEDLMENIYLNKICAEWAKKSWMTTRGLGSWLDNLKQRLELLNLWKDDPTTINKSVCFLNRLYKPNSFLTAIKQVCAQKTGQGLNKLYVQTDVLKKMHWDPEVTQMLNRLEDGAYVFGFQLEGAAWDKNAGLMEESIPKQQFSVVPLIHCRAQLIVEGKVDKGIYQCPCYMTTNRDKSYVFTAQLKTKHAPPKWVLAGVSLILDVEGVSDAFSPGQKPPEEDGAKK